MTSFGSTNIIAGNFTQAFKVILLIIDITDIGTKTFLCA